MHKITDRKVKEALTKFELYTLRDTGVRKISGGFACADIFDYDEEFFDIKLTWGIQSDCEDVVHTEYYKMNRNTLKIEEA